MGYVPSQADKAEHDIAISREEYMTFVDQAIESVVEKFRDMKLIEDVVL